VVVAIKSISILLEQSTHPIITWSSAGNSTGLSIAALNGDLELVVEEIETRRGDPLVDGEELPEVEEGIKAERVGGISQSLNSRIESETVMSSIVFSL